MAKEPVGKLIKLSEATWNALAADAERCKRSSTKQLEAILSTYYGLDNVDLKDLVGVREAVSPHLAKSEQATGGKDSRVGVAFLERVIEQMKKEEGKEENTENFKGNDRKTGNG